MSCEPRQTPNSGTPSRAPSSMKPISPAEPRVLRVLVGVHRAAEDHDRVPVAAAARARRRRSRRPSGRAWSPRSTTTRSKSPPPPVGVGSWTTERTRIRPTVAAALGPAWLRECHPGRTPSGRGRLAGREAMSRRDCGGGAIVGNRWLPGLEQRQLGRRRLDPARRRHARLVEQAAQDLRAARREVVAVVVEQRVDLVRLVRRAAGAARPTRRAPPASRASRTGRRRCRRGCSRSARCGRGSGRRRRGGSPRRSSGETFDARVRGLSSETNASPFASRNASVSARSSSSVHERWRNSISGTSGARRSGARASSAFASADFVNRGWYWSRTPRSLPESSSGSSAARKSRNASSVGSPSCQVIAADALTWNVNSSGVRRAHRSVTAGSGSA